VKADTMSQTVTCHPQDVLRNHLRATCAGYQETDELYSRIVRRVAGETFVAEGLAWGVVSAICSYVNDLDEHSRQALAVAVLNVEFGTTVLRACADPQNPVVQAAIMAMPAQLPRVGSPQA